MEEIDEDDYFNEEFDVDLNSLQVGSDEIDEASQQEKSEDDDFFHGKLFTFSQEDTTIHPNAIIF